MSSIEPLESDRPGVLWLGGELSAPPWGAKIDDRWLPDGEHPCHVLTAAGWVADPGTVDMIIQALNSPPDA